MPAAETPQLTRMDLSGTVPGQAFMYGCMHIENRGVRPPKSITRRLFVDAAYDGELAVSVRAAEQLQLELEFVGTHRWHGHDWAADSRQSVLPVPLQLPAVLPDGTETPSYRVACLSSAEALESQAGFQRQPRAAAAAAAAAVEAGTSSVSLRQVEDAQLHAQPPQQRRSSAGCTQPPAAAAAVAAAEQQQEPWTQRIRASDGTLELCRVPGPLPEVPSFVLGARGLR